MELYKDTNVKIKSIKILKYLKKLLLILIL